MNKYFLLFTLFLFSLRTYPNTAGTHDSISFAFISSSISNLGCGSIPLSFLNKAFIFNKRIYIKIRPTWWDVVHRWWKRKASPPIYYTVSWRCTVTKRILKQISPDWKYSFYLVVFSLCVVVTWFQNQRLQPPKPPAHRRWYICVVGLRGEAGVGLRRPGW